MSLEISQPDVADRSQHVPHTREQVWSNAGVVELRRIGDPDVLNLRGLIAKWSASDSHGGPRIRDDGTCNVLLHLLQWSALMGHHGASWTPSWNMEGPFQEGVDGGDGVGVMRGGEVWVWWSEVGGEEWWCVVSATARGVQEAPRPHLTPRELQGERAVDAEYYYMPPLAVGL